MMNTDKLKNLLKTAIRLHFNKLQSEFNDIYGYVLYTSDCRMGIGPVANRESDIIKYIGQEDYYYYRLGAHEWNVFDEYGFFDDVHIYVSECYEAYSEADEFDIYSEQFDILNEEVLVELEREGLFGEKTDNRFLCLFFTDSANPITVQSSKKLNTTQTHKYFEIEFG